MQHRALASVTCLSAQPILPVVTLLMDKAWGTQARAPRLCRPGRSTQRFTRVPAQFQHPGDYSIEETAFWSERVYSHVMRLLNEYGVVLEGILLKPNMCLPGEGRCAHSCTVALSPVARHS